MANKYWAGGIAGGIPGYMDYIDPTNTDGSSTTLAAGDICEVNEEDMFSLYIARNSSGATEALPDIVIPDSNPGNFWWELIERVPQDSGIISAIIYETNYGAF